jgi:hypothetical protein
VSTTRSVPTPAPTDAPLGALEELPERQREAWVAIEINGATPAQYAAVHGIQPTTARTHLRRARERLAPILDPFATPELSRSEAEELLVSRAVERYGLERAPDSDSPEWYDATEPDGTPIEIKGCAIRVPDGGSRRRGRWLIRWSNHHELEKAAGRYVLGVYDAREEVVAHTSVPAERISELLEGAVWWRSREHDDDAAQICYAEVFSDLDERLRQRNASP